MAIRFTSQDEAYMRRALALAERGRGLVEPNPVVGCVLVRGGRIVGEGYHRKFGGPHAEVWALREAGARARGATAYVTLEPCCHHGKTGPCTEALIGAGVRRVVAAMRDLSPPVCGRGFKRLKAAGVEVAGGLLAPEAVRMNAAYLKLKYTHRPWVILKWAQSLDGRIATRCGDSKWISSEASRAWVHRLRGRVDAIVVGVGTAIADDPLLTCRQGAETQPPGGMGKRSRTRRSLPVADATAAPFAAGKLRPGVPGPALAHATLVRQANPTASATLPAQAECRVGGRQGRPKRVAVRVVLDPHLRLPLSARLVRTAKETPTLVVTDRRMVDSARARRLRQAGVEVLGVRNVDRSVRRPGGTPAGRRCHWAEMRAGGPRHTEPAGHADPEKHMGLDLGEMLDEFGRRGTANIMVEGGGQTLGAFIDAGLADEAVVFVSPRLIGGQDAVAAIGGIGPAKMSEVRSPVWTERRQVSGDSFYKLIFTDPAQLSPLTSHLSPSTAVSTPRTSRRR